MIVVMLSSVVDLRVPVAHRVRVEALFALTDGFCVDALDFEYAELCRRMVARLARKRPTPLVRGNAAVWAAGVVYAVARLNFGFDRSQSVRTSADSVAAGFQVAKSTASAKATQIEKLLGLRVFEPDLLRADVVGDHPLAWVVEVDGVVVDARLLPVELQRLAREHGLIPFVPPDRVASAAA
jgi:hypothetical protein